MNSLEPYFSERKKILLVDDESKSREVVAHLISASQSFETLDICSDFNSALKYIKRNQALIIVMDIVVGGISGIPFIKKVKDSKDSVQILIVTEHDDERVVFDVFKAGADGFILKSEGLHKIINALDQLVSKESPLSSRITQKIISSFKVNSHSPLSTRESEILKLVSQGFTAIKIADALHISQDTARTHIKNIYRKLKVNSKYQAVQLAIHDRLI